VKLLANLEVKEKIVQNEIPKTVDNGKGWTKLLSPKI